MMNRFAFLTGHNLCYRAVGIASRQALCPAYVNAKVERYSTKASELKNVLPKLWISKMKTAFAWLDVDGDGYLTEKDFEAWINEMAKLFPDMSKDQKDILISKKSSVWNDLWGAKGQDYKITENMYIERFYDLATQEGGEDMIRKEWEKNFAVMDVNKDGVISKSEHRRLFDAWKNDTTGAIVAFRAIDENMDGVITCDEFVKTATEFFLNFTDEAKCSKYFFGPLKC